MPLAFNLSQDQTLQFNHCKYLKLNAKRGFRKNLIHLLSIWFLKLAHFLQTRRPVETKLCLCPNAHTYRLLVVKEQFALIPA
jgi:hypothetical protein